MSSSSSMHHCRGCRTARLFVRPGTSHLLHLILSVLTLCLWLPVWFLLAASHRARARCTQCGRGAGITWGHAVLGLFLLCFLAAILVPHARAESPEFTPAQLQQVRIIRAFLDTQVFLGIDRPPTSYPRVKVARLLFRDLPHAVQQESTRAVLAFMHGVNPWNTMVLIVDEDEREIGAVKVGSGLHLYGL